MVDVTVAKEVVLASGTTVKMKLTTDTDWNILQKVIDDTVSIAPNGGDPLILEAIDGVESEFPQKIKSWKAKFTVWANANDITIWRAAMGEPTVTGTNPYVHTFTGGTIGQDVDFRAEGNIFGSSTKYVRVTGSSAAAKITSLDIVKGQNWKFGVEITISGDQFIKEIGGSANLT